MYKNNQKNIKNIKVTQKTHSVVRSSGFTLIELLLYIALYSILFTVSVSLYSQMLLITTKMKKEIQKTEVVLYAELLAYSNPYTEGESLEEYKTKYIHDMRRILTYYPQYSLKHVGLQIIKDTQTYTESVTIALEYDSFSHSIMINLI